MDALNICPVVTVEGCGLYNGHLVKMNGNTAYYRPYDGKDSYEVADEFMQALGSLVQEKLGYPAEQPEDEY